MSTPLVVHRVVGVATLIALLAASAFAVLSAARAHAQAPAGDRPVLSPEVEKVRAALEKYQDPVVAVHNGYFSTLGCIEYPSGLMGIHFLNPRLIGPVPDPMAPPILLYEPVGDKLRLIGAEWFIPVATGVKERPTLFGQPFDGPMEGHEPLQPRELVHYDLHVWLFKHNPAGLFSPANPTSRCPQTGYTLKDHLPKIISVPQK